VKETLEKTMLAPCPEEEEGGREEEVEEVSSSMVVVEEGDEEEGREDEGGRGLTLITGVRSRRVKTCGWEGGREGGREMC